MTTILPTGLYTARQLRDLVGRTEFDAMVRSGTARRVRHGWYSIGEPPSDVLAAVLRGGVLSCVSALKRRGVWTPDDPNVHVRGDAAAVKNRRGRFCRTFGRPEPARSAVDDVPTALRHAVRCLDGEGFIVVCDSILNRGIMTAEEIEHIFRDAPEYVHRLLAKCDGSADSGPETMTRLRLTSKNVALQPQVAIDGVGTVDFLIGDWLIIEIDGWEYHGDKASFRNDRIRDVNAHALGYTPLRFTYEQIVFEWAETEEAILDAIRHRVHLRPSRLV